MAAVAGAGVGGVGRGACWYPCIWRYVVAAASLTFSGVSKVHPVTRQRSLDIVVVSIPVSRLSSDMQVRST